MITISNTQVGMFNTCEFSEFLRFGLEIEPQQHMLSPALKRGLLGHEAFQKFYELKKNGHSNEECLETALTVIIDDLKNLDPISMMKFADIYEQLITLFKNYFKAYPVDPFEILEIEKVYKTRITDDISYGLRLDLLGKYTTGEHRGSMVLIDHKFVYNFKTQAELDMDAQLLKYGKTLRDNGVKVYKSLFNQLRYRPLKNPEPHMVYRRDFRPRISQVGIDRVWEEQKKVAIKIAERRTLPIAEQKEQAIRNLSPHICRGCYFQSICRLDLEGKKIHNEVVANYQKNTYGYTDLGEE